MKYRINRFLLVFGLIGALLFSCGPDENEKPQNNYLLTYDVKTNINAATIQALLNTYGMQDIGDLATKDIRIYAITYKTKYFNEEITASGIVSVPYNNDGPVPVISAHRGTIFAHTDAPSEQSFMSGYEMFSSAGFATFIPDMIGFGASTNILHPYYNYELTTGCAIDMINAGFELLNEIEIGYNGKLFLYGYSEGGYITMATHKEIELHYPELEISAVATGAGSYNLNYVMQDISERDVFTSPGFLVFIVYSYKVVNNWEQPLSYFFNEPYASAIPDLLDGSMDAGQINASLNDTLEILFTPEFLGNVKNGEEDLLLNAFSVNSVNDWKPMADTRIYHSRMDQYIPFSDSENTYTIMENGGGNVEFIELAGASHEEAGLEMTMLSFLWFNELAGF